MAEPAARDEAAATDELEDLLSAARSGDQEAFAQLVQRLGPSLGRLISGLVDDPELVRDLVQETFVRAYCALAGYRPGSVGLWLRQIAVNVARQHLRSRWGRLRVVGNVDAGRTPEHDSPDRAAASSEQAERVRRAVAHLPPDQSEAVRLRFLLGESYPAMAALSGLPESTLRSRVKAALPRLRAELADYFDEETG